MPQALFKQAGSKRALNRRRCAMALVPRYKRCLWEIRRSGRRPQCLYWRWFGAKTPW